MATSICLFSVALCASSVSSVSKNGLTHTAAAATLPVLPTLLSSKATQPVASARRIPIL